jgi:prepilin-type processing-associated H-X9-DG protein
MQSSGGCARRCGQPVLSPPIDPKRYVSEATRRFPMADVDDRLVKMDRMSKARDVNTEGNLSGDSPTVWFSRRNCLVLILIACLVLGMAFPAIQVSREKSRRSLCAHNLSYVGWGLLNYHETYQRFPYAYVLDQQGQRRFGWRVSVLPFITSNNVYDRYYEAYRKSGNDFSLAPFYDIDLGFFRCPSDPVEPATTSYFAVTGKATAWPAPSSSCLKEFVKPSRSILVVESSRTGIHWVEPRDFQFDKFDFAIRSRSRMGFSSPRPRTAQDISSEHGKGANVLFADGGVEFLAKETEPNVIEQMLGIAGLDAPSRPQPSIRCRWVRDPDSTDPRFPYKMMWYSPSD